MKIYSQQQKNLWPFNVWPYFRRKFVISCWSLLMSAKNKQILRFFFFFWFLKVLIKGYVHAKFQLPTVSPSFSIYNPPPIPPFLPIYWTSMKKPIQNKVKGCTHYIFASLFFKSKKEHLWNLKKCFLFHFKNSFCSRENHILIF